jgi:hypothetical protein
VSDWAVPVRQSGTRPATGLEPEGNGPLHISDRAQSEGGKEAIRADEDVVPASEARKLEERVRDLERLLGRKTMEVEILKEALDLARAKKPTLLSRSPVPGDSP